MVLAVERSENIEGCERKFLVRGWEMPNIFNVQNVTCVEWPICVTHFIEPKRVFITSKDFPKLKRHFIQELFFNLGELLETKVNILEQAYSPAFVTALTTVKGSDKLASSELQALKSLIGGAYTRNKLDIEEFYSQEDDLGR